MGFFLKFISWSRRIVLKRFQNAPGSLKHGKGARKKCWPNKFDDILLSGRWMTPGAPGVQYEKVNYFFLQTKFLSRKKNIFSKLFFSHQILYISSQMRYFTLPADHSNQNGTTSKSSSPPSPWDSNHPPHIITVYFFDWAPQVSSLVIWGIGGFRLSETLWNSFQSILLNL